MDAQQIGELQEGIAREIFAAAQASGRDWEVASVHYSTVGGYAAPLYKIDEGDRNPQPIPYQAYFQLRALRVAMAASGELPWFTASVKVEASGTFGFSFDYETEPIWSNGITPSVGEFRRDLSEFPQLGEALPLWFSVKN